MGIRVLEMTREAKVGEAPYSSSWKRGGRDAMDALKGLHHGEEGLTLRKRNCRSKIDESFSPATHLGTPDLFSNIMHKGLFAWNSDVIPH